MVVKPLSCVELGSPGPRVTLQLWAPKAWEPGILPRPWLQAQAWPRRVFSGAPAAARTSARGSIQSWSPTSGPAVLRSSGPSHGRDPQAAGSVRHFSSGPPSGRSTASRSRRPSMRGLDHSTLLLMGGRFRQPQVPVTAQLPAPRGRSEPRRLRSSPASGSDPLRGASWYRISSGPSASGPVAPTDP
ncbi:hypothetical protein NDU88_007066 [Pleurodeles waltl]|uniref:Uncharacterized protein n=1 Tax=Pleurodeles waltl TaxID=8319 RepID=A0AAV7PK60_PLEWA|nr:hypothetical protein NDU88_007066 [Pleurodeles waltl]